MALKYVRAGEDRYKVFKLEQKLKKKFKEEGEKNKLSNKYKLPTASKKMTYKLGNPLKKILSHKKPIIKVGGY